jgi:DHA1 family multidrug resistance protein-like MFS transporter
MARFLFCSFALVLLYPSGIDMYLVGLPHIARDLGASEAQLHIAFSAYLAGMASSMVFAGKIADKAGRQPVAITGAIIFALASLCSQAQTAPCSWPDALSRALALAATWWRLPFCATP